jgi:beta-N-acetylhexosaminidase
MRDRFSSILLAALILVSCRSAPPAGMQSADSSGKTESVQVSLGPADPFVDGVEVPDWLLPEAPGSRRFEVQSELLVESCLRQLSLEQKIGQRLLSGIPGTRLTERSRRLVRDGFLGGVLLTRQNVAGREQLTRLTSDLQAQARQNRPAIGLLVAVDQEGGRVSRLDMDRLSRFPPPHDWAGYGDPYYIEAVAYITSREARALGCNLNLAPVLDLYALGDGTVIGDRSMGAEAGQLAELGLAYLAGARRAGMAAAIKHFPGHGRTVVDTHQRLAVLDVDEQTLWGQDLLPFRRAIEDSVEVVMTAHILYPRLDPDYPVTLSEKIVRGLLRGKLGFEGVVVSDDIEMGALAANYPTRAILKRAILAGVDIILEMGGLDALKLIQEIKGLVASGELTEAQIDEGVRRVLRLKVRCGLLPVQGA